MIAKMYFEPEVEPYFHPDSYGYSINSRAEDLLSRGCRAFIQKPYNISDLSQFVRKVLTAPTCYSTTGSATGPKADIR
jgi:hypothetical protein